MYKEKVYDFIKDMEESFIRMNKMTPGTDKESYFQGVRVVLKTLYLNDLIRFSDLKKIEDIIDK